jgi:hypothetical protein
MAVGVSEQFLSGPGRGGGWFSEGPPIVQLF